MHKIDLWFASAWAWLGNNKQKSSTEYFYEPSKDAKFEAECFNGARAYVWDYSEEEYYNIGDGFYARYPYMTEEKKRVYILVE